MCDAQLDGLNKYDDEVAQKIGLFHMLHSGGLLTKYALMNFHKKYPEINV